MPWLEKPSELNGEPELTNNELDSIVLFPDKVFLKVLLSFVWHVFFYNIKLNAFFNIYLFRIIFIF